MSTKTTFKRIALVTVAALGFGLLSSVAPASATAGGASVSTTSLTVVGGTTGTGGSGLFYVDVTDTTGAAAALTAAESLTVTVTGKPSYLANGTSAAALTDIAVQAVATTDGGATFAAVGNATNGGIQVPNAPGTYASNNWTYDATDAPTGTASRYWFAVYSGGQSPVDAGAYTLRVRLVDSTGFIRDSSLSVKFVTSAADAGPVLTLSSAGGLYTGQALSFTTANKLQATLTDAAGGRLVKAAATTASLASRAPDLSAAIVTTSTGVAASDVLAIADTGIAAVDHVASTTAQVQTFNTYSKAGDGTYGITAAATTGIVSTASVLKSLRVRYGAREKLLAVTIYGTTSAIDAKTDLTLTATGVLAADQLIKSDVATTTAYTLPTSATSAKLRINIDNALNDAVADQPMTVKTTWSGNYATASVSPATSTTGTVLNTDASGNIDLTVTNSAPLAGAVATVTITGYGYTAGTSRGASAGSTIVTLTWDAASATTITVIDPVALVKVKTGTTNVLTVSVKDQFGALMSGEALQPSLSSASSNYSATTTYAAITTGSAGTATFSLTDAVATTATSDAVSFASISNSAATPGTFTLSYVATLPVVSTMTGYYSNDATATASTLVPSTGVYADSGAKLIIKNDRDQSKSLAAVGSATTDDMVAFRVKAVTSTGAAATGAAVTITGPTGGWVLNSSGLPATTRTIAVGSDGYVSFQLLATVAGSLTFTATSGTISSTITLVVAVPTYAAGRTVAITGASTATANSDGVPMTVTVKDRYGNAVDGVTLTLAATGVAAFAGGATTQSFTTDSTGTYTFMAKSYTAAGGTGTYKVSAGNATDASSIAGYVGATAVDSTLAAGASSASATVTFAAGEDAAAANAQAATDAAAEATDAANAATDAANAAAEAADAATAAAQDAADAVAALSAQVSTMISALKAQLTSLTNLVIKIQKKVKA